MKDMGVLVTAVNGIIGLITACINLYVCCKRSKNDRDGKEPQCRKPFSIADKLRKTISKIKMVITSIFARLK